MILLTGATGRLGGEIIRLLRQAQVEVRALVRVGSEYFWLNDTGATYFFGDLRDPGSLRRALQGCSHVIHAAGVGMENHANHHHSTTLEGGLALVDAAENAGIQHFVQIGCAAVAHSSHVESLHCQAAVETHLARSPVPHTILRSAPFLEDLAAIAQGARKTGSAVFWGNGQALISPIARKDLALFAISALDHPSARDRVLSIGGPETAPASDFLTQVCELEGVSVDSIHSLAGTKRALTRRTISLVLGRRWQNYIDWRAALWDIPLPLDGPAVAEVFDLPLTPTRTAMEQALEQSHPREDPTARDERVVHRQFHATVYTPGETPADALPKGPDDRSSV